MDRTWDWKDEFTYFYALLGGVVSAFFGFFSGSIVSIGLLSGLFCFSMCLLQWKIAERTYNKKMEIEGIVEKAKRYNPSQR